MGNEATIQTEDELTIKTLLAMVMADIDIFLLQNKEQTADNDKKSFSREEIREQLKKSFYKIKF